MIKERKPIYALELQNARYFDTGNKLEYLKTVIEFGLNHSEMGGELRKHLALILR